jgi:CubicO group peptidase (beta-lactamase class C family)
MFVRIAAAIMAATVFMAASAAFAATPKEAPEPSLANPCNCHSLDANDLEAWLDGLVPYALNSGDIAGGVVVVVKDGKVLLEKGFGYADVGKRIPFDPQRTMTRAGSTSKLFTWTAVMQLVEQGKLDLNRDVNDYLDFKISPGAGKRITMLDLMNHRAGFEEGLKDILTTDPRNLESTETYLKQHLRPILFAPGTVPAYSNYGAALAGYIVERLSGEPFERYAEHHIFAPLGMAHTTFDQPLPDRFKDAVSRGYRTATTPPQPYELVVTRPAGSLATTGADMARFMIAQLQQGRLDDYQLLSSQTIRLMQSPSESGLAGFGTMAHGFFYDHKNGHTVIGHGGDTVLFHTEFDLLPEEGVGIFYNFNSRGRESAVYGLRKSLFDGFMDRYFPNSAPQRGLPTLASGPSDALKIAGRYQSSRRLEHGFLSVFYLLQQSAIAANPDGTIEAPNILGSGEDTFHEVGPNLWQMAGGTRQLALQSVDGVKTVIDSEDPTSVLQAAPLIRSASLNLTVLIGSLIVLAVNVIAWPVSWMVRRRLGVQSRDSAELRRLRFFTRVAAAFDVLYLAAWMWLLKPVLSLDLQLYSTASDPLVRALQCAGLAAIAAAAFGIFSVWRASKLRGSRLYQIWNAVSAAAMLGVVWFGFMGHLIGFDLNY